MVGNVLVKPTVTVRLMRSVAPIVFHVPASVLRWAMVRQSIQPIWCSELGKSTRRPRAMRDLSFEPPTG